MPEAQGMDGAMLAKGMAFIEQEKLALHSLLIIRHGLIVSETYYSPYTAETLHELYSVTKSFTATLVGIAIDQGKLPDVNASVLGFFAKQNFANNDPRKQAMRLENFMKTSFV